MEALLAAAALVVGLLLLWTGRRRLEFSSFTATLLSLIDVAGFVVSAAALGWVGIAILIGVNLVAVLAWSVASALRKQAILVNATVQNPDLSIEEVEGIWSWMGREESFATILPLARAQLIRALATQDRRSDEIRAIAPPIAKLALIYECDPVGLAPRFDRLIRLYGKEAQEAEDIAAILSASTQNAAASFDEMVDAMLAVGEPLSSDQGAEVHPEPL